MLKDYYTKDLDVAMKRNPYLQSYIQKVSQTIGKPEFMLALDKSLRERN